MEHVVESVWVLLREPEGPLVPYLEPFARSLKGQGFNRNYLGAQIRWVAYFSKWLQGKQIAVREITDEHARHFFDGAAEHPTIKRGAFAALRRLMDFLGQLGVIQPLVEQESPSPIQQVVGAFATYLRLERALSDKTLIQYCPFIEHFLSGRFGNRPVDLSALRAIDVIRFVQQQAAQLSPARAKAATTALRSFFRYLRYRGETQFDLVAAVPTVPNWSMTGIPRAIAPDHLRAVLEHCPRDTPVGRRDYAIIMLLAQLGLRSCEIVSLTLESLDWEAGTLAVAGKGKQAACLPLPVDVGAAIADYLRRGRPISSSRALFLRAFAPIRDLGSSTTVGTIVGAAIKRAGIETRYHGTHQFRHALATDMLRHGATLTEIGSLLRHRQAKTTSIYAKVDLAALRRLSLPWPGDVR